MAEYRIRLHGELDDSRILQQIKAIEKKGITLKTRGGTGTTGGKGGKGSGTVVGDIDKQNKKLKENTRQTRRNEQATIGATKAKKKFGSTTLDITKKVAQFGAVTAVIRGVTDGIGDMVQNVYELDKALTEFKKVSDLSGKGLEEYTSQAYETGRTVAKTGTEMIQAATEFKKAGFNEKDSLELGRVASMYQNVADQEITAGEAANFIVSQMKAYNMTAQDSEHIIDAVNEVSNKYAVSSADIATNIGKASAAMATGNMTYEQSIGLMTAMTEITRNGAKSARGLVSIQSRYNQILDENSTTGKKLTAWYKEHNIELKDQNGQLKSFFEVGGEVAKQWDKLSDNEKKYYLNAQAGANQSQNLAALMRNYKTALEATATAENSAGSAAKENARYMESMEGKLQNLRSAWEKLSYKLINSEGLKKAIDGLTKALDYLASDAGMKTLRTLGDIAVMFASFKAISGVVGGFKSLSGALTGVGEAAGASSPLLAEIAAMFAGGGIGWGVLLSGALVGALMAFNEELDPENKYNETTEKLKDLQDQYKELGEEYGNLLDKKLSGKDLTAGEEQRLKWLKQQLSVLEKQEEVYKKLQAQQYHDKEMKPDKKSGAQGRGVKSVTKGTVNYSQDTKQQIKDTDALTSKLKKYNDIGNQASQTQRNIAKAQEEVNSARRSGDLEGESKALEKLNKANGEYAESMGKLSPAMQDVKKKMKEWLDSGMVDQYDDAKKSYNAVKKIVDAYDDLGKKSGEVGDKSLTKALKPAELQEINKDLTTMGTTIGIVKNKSGEVENIDFGKFDASLKDIGYSSEQVREALSLIEKENPEATVTVDGVEVAQKDVDQVLDYLDKLNGDDAEATVEINGTEYAVEDIGNLNHFLTLLNGTSATADIGVDGAKESEEKVESFNGAVKDLPLQHNTNVKVSGTEGGKKKATSLDKAIRNIPQSKTPQVRASVHGERKVDDIKNKISSVPSFKSVLISVGASISSAAKKALGIGGNAQGTRHAKEGWSEVNEQGFEFIRDAKTGMLRIAGGGHRTVTALNEGDTVYTHAQSMQMLSNDDDIEIPQHKKGKKGKKKGKKQKKRQKKYDTAKNKITSAFDKALEALEHKRDVEHWTDAQYTKAYNNLYNKYSKKLATFNKNYKGKKAKGVTKSGMGTDRQRAKEKANADLAHDQATKRIEELLEAYDGTDATYDKASKAIKTALAKKQISRDEYNDLLKELKEKKKDYQHEAATKEIDALIGGQRGTQEDFNKTIKRLKELKKQNKLTAEEAEEYEKEAYKKHIEYEMNTLKFDRNSYKKSLALLEDAYAKKKLTDEEYYAYRQELAEKLLDLEKTEIEKSQELNDNKYSLAKAYVQKQIDALQKENEEQEKQNELIELQNNLLKAKSKRVKVYREGIGFTYEQDTEAIQEATKALQDFQNAQKNPELEKWEKVMELFDKLESSAEMKHLENLIGASAASMFGAMGTDIGSWTNWIKNNLAIAYGYADVLSNLDELAEYTDIEAYVNNLSSNIDSAINANRFASGTLNAPRGFARVAENGYEIALLGKGDAVMPHGVSKNLMEWGQYSPRDFVTSGGGDNLTYNFDKLVLPNVDNAHAFISELNKLPNAALQYSKGRR